MICSKAPLFPIHRFKQPLANCSTVHIESQLNRLSPLHTTHLQFPYFQHFTFQADEDAEVWSTRYIEFWIRFWFTSWSATSSKLWMIQPNFCQSSQDQLVSILIPVVSAKKLQQPMVRLFMESQIVALQATHCGHRNPSWSHTWGLKENSRLSRKI
jgi:hypothetical protein